ncbi:MAG TPA: helicase-related protein, partial [Frankiaceae bacterium]|nr:helicase-related protein [Frankiaceae bacterium]
QDQYRGPVWEEVIIHTPPEVDLVCLSATVSNAEEFADWIQTVRGATVAIIEERRPVELTHFYMVGEREADELTLLPTFVDGKANPEAVKLDARAAHAVSYRGPPRRSSGGLQTPRRSEVVERLDREAMLPAIFFIFSRAACDDAVRQCLMTGMRLTIPEERDAIRAIAEARTAGLSDDDLEVLGYREWMAGLEAGFAAHHAGMLPTFKEVVEELFSLGLVKAVFATETLALGINMPARSVVLEKLSKWNGETHADITPGEYTQLTGRAGRRGIDVEGHAVVLWQPGLDPLAVAGLASTRTYPLRSSFRPSYNMAVNLVGSVGRERARALLESSFAQFQADKAVVGLARQVARNEEALEGYAEAATCHLGDFMAYAGLRLKIKDREARLARDSAAQRRLAAVQSLEQLRPGDVVRVPAGRRAGLAVVLDPGLSATEDPRPFVLLEDKQVKRLSMVEFAAPVEPLARVKVPRNFNPRSPQARRDLASSLRALGLDDENGRPRKQRSNAADDEDLARLRRDLRAHPCHGCDEREDHARWAERYQKLRRDTDNLQAKVRGRTNSIARTFDRVVALLESLGYVSGDAVTASGRQLAQVYNESDLLVVECLRSGLWDALDPAELAACASVLVYEARGQVDTAPKIPGGQVRDTLAEMVRLWARLKAAEEDQRLDFLREPDPGFAWAAHRWASGARLDTVLTESELTAGDFVRWAKMLLDLLSQVAEVAAENSPVRDTAKKALGALRRGVVAYSSVV